MKCPVDGATLTMTERSGVEIDYCPTCRGVWLDRGELDKIIDKAMPAVALAEPARAPEPRRDEPRRDEPRRDDYRRDEPRREGYRGDDRREYGDKIDEWRGRDEEYGKRRKKSILGEIFDF